MDNANLKDIICSLKNLQEMIDRKSEHLAGIHVAQAIHQLETSLNEFDPLKPGSEMAEPDSKNMFF